MTEPEGNAEERAHVFAVLWAVGMAFHAAVFHELLSFPIIPVAVIGVLLRPSSSGRLAFLAVSQVGVVAWQLPSLSNHWLLAGFANSAIVVAWLRIAAGERRLQVGAGELFACFAPVLRVLVLVLYGLATFHKLNASYFDRELSCGVWQLEKLVGLLSLPAAPVAIEWLAIYASVAIEATIFLALLVPSLRTPGLVLAAGFHLLLSLDVYHGFVAILFALFFLFTDEEFVPAARAWLGRLRARLPAALLAPPPALRATARGLLVALVAVALVAAWFDDRRPWSTIYALGERTLFFLWAPSLFVAFLATQATRKSPARYSGSALRIRGAALAVIPLLAVANGAAPYLGLKTEGSFAMFSNLRTEGGRSNHFLVPKTLQLAGWDDLVAVAETSIPRLGRLRDRDRGITWFELRSIAARHPEASLIYTRAAVRRELARIGDDPELSRSYPWWVRKLVRFRSPRAPYGACQH